MHLIKNQIMLNILTKTIGIIVKFRLLKREENRIHP